MKPLKIIFLVEAIIDLEEIWTYTLTTWSLEQADRYYHLIMKETEYLSSNPGSGKDFSEIRKGYRCTKVKSHLIFYRYSETEIEIVRILHESMDIPNKF
jgi:toxin ParE1/3/4